MTLQGSGGGAAAKGSAGGDTGTPTFQATPVTPTATMQGGRTPAPTPGVPDDGSCRSWASIAGDIYMKLKEELRNFSPMTVRTSRMEGRREVGPLTWWACQMWTLEDSIAWKAKAENRNRRYPWRKKAQLCYDTMSPSWVLTMNHVLLNYWNKQVDNNWATIGPRKLTTDETHTGRLVSTTGRLFITPTMLYTDSVTLEIKKVEGKARTEVTACVYEPGGDRFIVWDFTIPKGKKNKGYVWTKTLNGVGGKILSVHLKSKSGTNTLKYELKAVKNEE